MGGSTTGLVNAWTYRAGQRHCEGFPEMTPVEFRHMPGNAALPGPQVAQGSVVGCIGDSDPGS
jgi:hypothetical protein